MNNALRHVSPKWFPLFTHIVVRRKHLLYSLYVDGRQQRINAKHDTDIYIEPINVEKVLVYLIQCKHTHIDSSIDLNYD